MDRAHPDPRPDSEGPHAAGQEVLIRTNVSLLRTTTIS